MVFRWPLITASLCRTGRLLPARGTGLDVYPDLTFPPQWGWETGTGGDNIGYQDFFGQRSATGSDSAFALGGTAVPEPGTLVMLGTGVLGLAGVIRRRLI